MFSFLFHDQSFKKLYNKKFPASNELIIKPSTKEEIENTAKESFFVSDHRILFFQETFRNIDRKPENRESYYNAINTLKPLNPLITSISFLNRFVKSVFKEKERLLGALEDELMNTTNEEDFIKKYMTIYPKIDLIKKCFLRNDEKLFCINDGYGHYHKSSLSFFLNSFFDEINKRTSLEQLINIQLPPSSSAKQPVFIAPEEIRTLQEDLNGCFYLFITGDEEPRKKDIETCDKTINFYDYIENITEKGPLGKEKAEVIWQQLRREQKEQMNTYIKQTKPNANMTIEQLGTTIPVFFLKNMEKMYKDFSEKHIEEGSLLGFFEQD